MALVSPRVAVLMTVHNGLPYLRQAIESVLTQTFTDFEFLIIDDASTDGSVACIRSYTDPRIRLVCNERNMGQTRSLNRGLELARGEYVARLDQDDVSLPERLGKQVAFLDGRPDVAVVGTWTYRIDSGGRKTGLFGKRQLGTHGSFVGSLLLGTSSFYHSSVMFRREVTSHVGGYDESFASADDYDLWIRLAMRRYSAAVMPEPLVMIRSHGGQQTVTKTAVHQRSAQRAHGRMVECFADGDARLVGMLLRMDGSFWDECKSREQVRNAVQRLDALLIRVRTELGLSSEEFMRLKRSVCPWIGGSALVAILRGKTQGLPIYLWACRQAKVHAPSVVSYGAFFAAFLLAIPRVRRLLSAVGGKLSRLRYEIGLRG